MIMEDGVITAEEIGEKIREVSIAEFFEKNRHLLGYENPTKSLFTVVKEGVDNSLTYDIPTLIFKDGKFYIEKIGKIIDEQFEKYKNFKIVERNGMLEKLNIFDPIYTFSFNPFDFQIGLRRITTLFRHKVNSKIFRVTLEGGRSIEITDYHSVFVLKNGRVREARASELKEGDYIVVPRKLPEFIILDPIDLSVELPKYIPISRLRIFGVRKFINEIKDELKSILPKNKWYRIGDFRKTDSMPLEIAIKLKSFEKLKKELKIGVKNSRRYLPILLFPSKELARFLGIFLAEGSILHNNSRIYLSFGKDEKEIATFTVTLIEKLFGEKAIIRKAHETAINVIVNSSILSYVLRYVFGFSKARKKRVPSIIFTFPNEWKKEFLFFYAVGDGYPTKQIWRKIKGENIELERIIFSSASKELMVDLSYLLSFLGFSYSIEERKRGVRKVKDKIAKFGKSYILYLYLKQKISPLNKFPIDCVEEIKEWKLRNQARRQECFLLQTLKESNGIVLNEEMKNFIQSNLGVLRVKEIEEIEYSKEFVYDFSVPFSENFLAGNGPIFCHNSIDASIEARILPTIKVSVKQKEENVYKVKIEDNGPGLPPEKIPIAFGKFLVGSKFYRYRQSIGTQGIGIKGAILYAQLTTGKPAKITTYYKKKKHEFELMIDVLKNEPKIISHNIENLEKDLHGLSIELLVEGRYIEKGQSIPTYLRYLWLANPYLEIVYDGPESSFKLERVVNVLPPSPKEIKPHPYGVELGKFKRMLHLSNARTVAGFLSSEFSRVSLQTAEKICKLARVDSKKKPKEVTDEEAEKLHKAMQAVKLKAPPTDCLSPLKEEFLIEALKKEFQPEFVTAVIRKPSVYRGNPFQVQVAIAYGGKIAENNQETQTSKLLRFANHTPLLYNQSDCAITRAVEEVDWRNYGLTQPSGSLPQAPLIIFVDFLSVWIPYKSEGKQAIAEYPEIIKEIKLALQEAGRQLAVFLHKKVKTEQLKMRANIFEAYSNVFSEFVSELTGKDVEYIKKKILELIKKGEYKEGEEKRLKEEVVEVK